ncbi:MAG TPA: NAD(P)-dependent oxidoreductase [Acidimicrobiia bacterium]|nr:NAD(P)-dependent oxidoreductase [Acidimicrobiia bacterium]
MTLSPDATPDRPPQVLLFDPITWIHDWSYEEERTALAAVGAELVNPADRAERDRLLADADVVVVSSIDRLTAAHIDQLERCVGVLCYSAGMDAVDLEATGRAKIAVTNIRAGTADVADHAMTLLLAAWRRLPVMIAEARAGRWDLEQHPEFRSISRLGGSTLGIFGAGPIGRAVADRARSFGMLTIATYRRPEIAEQDLPHVPLDRLMAEADALVLTASLNQSTRGIVDRHLLAGARPGMVLVNVGRGALVVERDLADALDAGIVAVAALDVRDPEPPDPDDDVLTGRPDVIQTPHSAGVSAEALSSLHRLAAEEIEGLLRRGGRI